MSDAPWTTICELVDDAARRFPDLEALVDGDVRWTFPELRDQIRASARALMASGIEPGDRVAVWAPNIWEWVVAGLGVHLAGGVLVPVNTRFKGREADFILQKSGARILFTVTDFLGPRPPRNARWPRRSSPAPPGSPARSAAWPAGPPAGSR